MHVCTPFLIKDWENFLGYTPPLSLALDLGAFSATTLAPVALDLGASACCWMNETYTLLTSVVLPLFTLRLASRVGLCIHANERKY